MTGLDPHTSLAMTYLRAYADHNRTARGMKRATRKAEHQLRMHWSVCATWRADAPEIAVDGLEGALHRVQKWAVRRDEADQ